MNERIRVYENLRTVSYTPFYLAEARNLYAAHGLEVEVVTSPAPSETAIGLIEGRVDVSWGGPMRVMLHHDRDPSCPLVCFCQVVARDPFVLVGREPRPSFRFHDLEGLRVGVVSEVPTPWMTLQDDLRRAGIDPDSIERAPQRTMPQNVEALGAKNIDVAQVMEPYATLAVESGAGHVWHEFAVRGPIAFTTFYTTRSFAAEHAPACAALTRTLTEAVREVYSLPAAEVAGIVASRFPHLALATLTSGIDRYRAAGLWARDPRLPVADFVRLKAALLSGGLIARDVPYESVVENALAHGASDGDQTSHRG